LTNGGNLACGALLEIVCLPESEEPVGMEAASAFKMYGRVVWQDLIQGMLGIAHL
jgi:hypothetical protein